MRSPKHSDQSSSDYAKNNQLFIKACELAGTPPTRRQASKYRGGRGKANAKFNEALAASSK